MIFHSRQSYKKSNKITGSPDFILDGTIYMPTHDLTLGGSGTINNVAKAGYVIADTFTYNGSSTFTFDSYTGVVAPHGNKAVLVKLVGSAVGGRGHGSCDFRRCLTLRCA